MAGRTNASRKAVDARLVEQLPLFVEIKPTRRRRKKPGPKRKRGSGAPHRERPELSRHHPVHVVLRVVGAIGSLRKRFMYAALREATIALALREHAYKRGGAFRIVHISIQRTHVHLLVEADNKKALSRGMQGFQISAAKLLNRAYSEKCGLARRRRGTVFPDRFHQEIIRTPKQARNSLAYVMNNWRKHREDRGDVQSTWNVDPFSSGALFDGWCERKDAVLHWRLRETYQPLVVYLPKTWLLREGWRRYGLVRFHEVPSAPPVVAA